MNEGLCCFLNILILACQQIGPPVCFGYPCILAIFYHFYSMRHLVQLNVFHILFPQKSNNSAHLGSCLGLQFFEV